MSGRPIGVVIRSITSSAWPTSASLRRNRAHLPAEPISPIEPSCGVRSAASHSAASSAWSCVMISTWVPGGSSASTSSGSTGTWWTCTRATASASTARRSGAVCVGARVDQVQLQVVPGQDAGQLEADVPQPEDRDGRHHRQGFEQHRHLAAAALHAVLVRRLVRQRDGAAAPAPARATSISSRARADRDGLEVAAADRAPGLGPPRPPSSPRPRAGRARARRRA